MARHFSGPFSISCAYALRASMLSWKNRTLRAEMTRTNAILTAYHDLIMLCFTRTLLIGPGLKVDITTDPEVT